VVFFFGAHMRRTRLYPLNPGVTPDKMVHASNGEASKHFDAIHREKVEEAHNVRVALATDGFNPYGMSAAPYTC
jgi:hypothetical protein